MTFTLPYPDFFLDYTLGTGPLLFGTSESQSELLGDLGDYKSPRLQILAGFLDMTLIYVSATPFVQSIPPWMEHPVRPPLVVAFPNPEEISGPFSSLRHNTLFCPVPALACAAPPLVACTTLPIHSSLLPYRGPALTEPHLPKPAYASFKFRLPPFTSEIC